MRGSAAQKKIRCGFSGRGVLSCNPLSFEKVIYLNAQRSAPHTHQIFFSRSNFRVEQIWQRYSLVGYAHQALSSMAEKEAGDRAEGGTKGAAVGDVAICNRPKANFDDVMRFLE